VERSDGSGPLLSRAAVDRRQFLRGIAAAGAVAGAGGLLAACGGSSPSTTPAAAAAGSAVKKRGGYLKVGLTGGSGSDTLDPHNGLTFLDSSRAQSLYNPLVQLDPNAQTEYVLAESIEVKSPTDFIIKLRPGITFHDGKPLTADDVIYTIRRIVSGKFSGANSLGPVDLAGLKALDKLTVHMPMTLPFASLIDQMAFWYYLYIIPDGFHPEKKPKPNGTGPFMYESFTAGERSVFKRNPNYWRHGLPWVDTLAIIDFSDNVALQDALATGAIHAAGALEGPQIAALSNTSGVTTVVSQTGAITPFTMRVDFPPFNDVRVRQALRYLVNRQQLIDSALDGYGVVASDVYSPYDLDFDSSLHRVQDIDQAKFLLKQAGHEKLKVTLWTSAVATGTVAMATVLAEQAAAAGVTITLQNVSPTEFFGKGNGRDTGYLNWPFSQDFYNYSPYLAQTSQSMLKTSPFNETHTSNRQTLYNAANATVNKVQRKQILAEMQKLDFNTGGYIIPAFIDGLDAYSTQITGYERGSKAGQPLTNLDFQYFAFV
jgi:peptide/nickel transport system substrate-binding protein